VQIIRPHQKWQKTWRLKNEHESMVCSMRAKKNLHVGTPPLCQSKEPISRVEGDRVLNLTPERFGRATQIGTNLKREI
jgi:hypothetical protein